MSGIQFRAGYMLESTRNYLLELKDKEADKINGLLDAALTFDVETSFNIKSCQDESFDSIHTVINNMICRGLPTLPSLKVERTFVEYMPFTSESINLGSISFPLKNPGNIDFKTIFNHLHLIDPRLNLHEGNYEDNNLGSFLERDFLFRYLPSEYSFMLQILNPQRELTSIVKADEARQFIKQRVDFAFECPYLETDPPTKIKYRKGTVIEIDGMEHRTLPQLILDKQRDFSIIQSKWDYFRIRSDQVDDDLKQFESFIRSNVYLTEAKNIFTGKQLLEEKIDTLQLILSPILIARIQKVLAELLLQGQLQFEGKSSLKIAVLERDVPGGYLALSDFHELWSHLNSLKSSNPSTLPEFDIDIFTTPEFQKAKLHKAHQRVYNIEEFSYPQNYDLVLDVSMLQRKGVVKHDKKLNDKVNWIVIRSAHYLDRSNRHSFYTGQSIQYRRLVNRNRDETFEELPDSKSILTFFLQNLFRKEQFREGQLPILDRVLQNKTTIGLLSTGGGKSLTYQLAALLQPGIVLVIDPIKSLMQDQYEGLLKNGITACNFINSQLSTQERKWAIEAFTEGRILISFVTPERLQIKEFRIALQNMYNKQLFFSYCVIDEVHCVSEWGHDFRTSYLELGHNVIKYCRQKHNKPIPLIGLTATASFDVLADVERELSTPGMEIDLDAIIRFENTIRPELQYEIEEIYFQPEFSNQQLIHNLHINRITGASKARRKLLKKCGDSKQKMLIQLLKEKIASRISEYNTIERLTDIGKHIYNAFLPEKIKMITNESDYCFFVKNQLELKLTENDFFEKRNDTAGVLFCPHKKGILGVTDKYNNNTFNAAPTAVEEKIQIAIDEKIISQNIQIGTFIGADANDINITKRITDESFYNLKEFKYGKKNLMIATKAFGMGIDKPNVRFTIHLNYPSSIESFVQEAGRAGRDGKLAINYILYNQQNFIRTNLNIISPFHSDYRNALNGAIFLESEKNEISKSLKNNSSKDINLEEYVEYFSVDRDIQNYFHDNSFKGIEKEQFVVNELFNEIHYFKSSLREIENRLTVFFGLDISLNLWPNGNNLIQRIYINPKLGYINLNNFDPVPSTDLRSTEILITTINLIYEISGIAPNNLQSLRDYIHLQNKHVETGIEKILMSMNIGEQKEVIIPFENTFNNKDEYANHLSACLNNLFTNRFSLEFIKRDLIENRPESFWKFVDKVAANIGIGELDAQKLEAIKQLYYLPRDKSDTDKAIYRLRSLGIIEEYSVDYNKNIYEVLIKKYPEAYYRETYRRFLERYYSDIIANHKLKEADSRTEESLIRKYSNHLIEFVYDQIAKKRRLAIEDMDQLCKEGLSNGEDSIQRNFYIKEYIFLYFNSKYARQGYTVDGENYSLIDDTQAGRIFEWDIVWKYMKVITGDNSGSPIDNLKHLRGACLRILRAQPDNPALLLLKSFSLFILSAQSTNSAMMEEALENAIQGFSIFQTSQNISDEELQKQTDTFRSRILSFTDNTEVKSLLENALNNLYLEVLAKKITQFKSKFLQNAH